ncbi:TVP38/TMEM64 family protein [Streptomyces griseoluteus]|uniref:TVP38/TMEM64 family protein n=1 Tax=Streptomyces griseoluteus TaxID=29306 RepID=UPI0036F6D1B8
MGLDAARAEAVRTTWARAGVRLGLLAAVMAGAAVTLISTAPDGLLSPGDATAGTAPTALAFIGVYAVATCVFIPKPALSAVAGVLFGLPAGLLVAAAGNTAGALIGYGAARLLGSDALNLLSTRSRHVGALRARLVQRPFVSMLWMRLTPGMPFAAVSVAAGSSRLPVVPFAVATALGTLPATGACVAMGTAASSLSSPVVWGPFGAAVAVFGTVFLIRRRRRNQSCPSSSGPGVAGARSRREDPVAGADAVKP